MKKFIVFVLILVVTVSLGVTTYYFLRDNEELIVKTESSIYLNTGDTLEIDAELKNAKIGNDVVITSLNTNVLEWNPALRMFDAKTGGAAIIEVGVKSGKINPVYIEVRVGDGTPLAPYYIDSEEDLLSIGTDSAFTANSNYILMQDISLNQAITPLCNTEAGFNGTFNGNSYSIKGLTITTTEGVLNAGLFAKIGSAGVVTDLTLQNANINGQFETAGAVAGINLGTVTRCEINAGLVASTLDNSSVGGVVGINRYSLANYGRVDRCSSNISVNGTAKIGGLVGTNDGALIINSYVKLDDKHTLKTISNNATIGGLVGINQNKDNKSAVVKNCYAISTISFEETVDESTLKVASLIGYNDEISVNAPNYIMGLYTNNKTLKTMNDEFNKSYNDTEIAEKANFIGLYNEFPKDATGKIDINSLNSYVSKKDSVQTMVKWDFTNVWLLNTLNEGYPLLNKKGANVPDDLAVVYNPSVIASTSDFLQFVADVNRGEARSYYVLSSDIDLENSSSFTPIGTSKNQFNGIFDGDGHTIKNVKISSSVLNNLGDLKKYAGLFGKIGSVAVVKNLTVQNITIESGATHAGAIVAYNEGTIQNCKVVTTALNKDVDNVRATFAAGGIAGMNTGTIEDCKVTNQTIGMYSNTGNVSYVGGIAGINGIETGSRATIQNNSVVTSYVVDYKNATGWDNFKWNYRSISNYKENFVGGIAGVNYYLVTKNYTYNTDLYSNIYNKKGAVAGVAAYSKSVALLNEGVAEVSFNNIYGGTFTGFSVAGLISNQFGKAGYNSVNVNTLYGAVVAGLSNRIAINARLNNCFVKAHISACDKEDSYVAGFANTLDYSSGSYGEMGQLFSVCTFDADVEHSRYDASDDYRQESTVIYSTRDTGIANNLIWFESGNATWDDSWRSTMWGDTSINNLRSFSEQECLLMSNANTVKETFSAYGFDLTKWVLEEGIMEYPRIDGIPEIEEI